MKCETEGCEISEGERETAKRLNMHPEDVHHIMDTHLEVLSERARESMRKAREKRSNWMKVNP